MRMLVSIISDVNAKGNSFTAKTATIKIFNVKFGYSSNQELRQTELSGERIGCILMLIIA
jgi:hypothetical protein